MNKRIQKILNGVEKRIESFTWIADRTYEALDSVLFLGVLFLTPFLVFIFLKPETFIERSTTLILVFVSYFGGAVIAKGILEGFERSKNAKKPVEE